MLRNPQPPREAAPPDWSLTLIAWTSKGTRRSALTR